MSTMCKLLKPCASGVRHRSSILSTILSKKVPYKQLALCFSSKSCDPGKSGAGNGSDQKGGEGKDPCEPSCCKPCPPPEDNPSAPTMYDVRKYGHCLPKNDVNMCFEPLGHIPTGVFRNTDCEILGLGAGKCCMYKNPEYFSYHHMTYYDMHLLMRCYRKPSPKTGRKP